MVSKKLCNYLDFLQKKSSELFNFGFKIIFEKKNKLSFYSCFTFLLRKMKSFQKGFLLFAYQLKIKQNKNHKILKEKLNKYRKQVILVKNKKHFWFGKFFLKEIRSSAKTRQMRYGLSKNTEYDMITTDSQ